MKRHLFILTLFLASILLISCSNSEHIQQFSPPHIGEWAGVDSGGIKAVIVFKENGIGMISFNSQVSDFKYVVDYAKKPIWLDLIYSREGKPYRAKLIVKFMDTNELKWRTFFNDTRPTEFISDDPKNTMILTRVKPVRET